MHRNRLRSFCLLGVLVLSSTATAWSASPVHYSTIYVDDMHCADCAKKIASRLYAVKGVVEVRADVPKSIAYVVPQKDKQLAARELWEAVEKAGFKPIKLETPQGVYKSKPK